MVTLAGFLFFVVSAIGMTHIVVDGSILEWFRQLVKRVFPEKLASVVDCYMCCGFWCGLFCAWATQPSIVDQEGNILIIANILMIFAGGLAASFLANFAATLLNWLEAGTIVNLEDNDGN